MTQIFKPYESKPITRMAFQILTLDNIEVVEGEDHTYMWHVTGSASKDSIEFKAYVEPIVGDWIVHLTDKDTYHVTDAVFRERNIVND